MPVQSRDHFSRQTKAKLMQSTAAIWHNWRSWFSHQNIQGNRHGFGIAGFDPMQQSLACGCKQRQWNARYCQVYQEVSSWVPVNWHLSQKLNYLSYDVWLLGYLLPCKATFTTPKYDKIKGQRNPRFAFTTTPFQWPFLQASCLHLHSIH